MGGGIAQWLAFLLLDPAAPGSNPCSTKIFSLHSLVYGQYRDRTHPALKHGISQMQFAVKVWAKYCKKVLVDCLFDQCIVVRSLGNCRWVVKSTNWVGASIRKLVLTLLQSTNSVWVRKLKLTLLHLQSLFLWDQMKTQTFCFWQEENLLFFFSFEEKLRRTFLIYFAASFEHRARALQSHAFARETPKEDQARFLSLSVTASMSLGLEASSKINLGLGEKLRLG